MAQQDDIIIIKTIENITTSILDYFLNVAYITEFEEDDLLEGQSFSASGKEEYSSLAGVAEKFNIASKIYEAARDIFAQKTNSGKNQSNLKRFIVLKKEKADATFEAALNRIGYQNSYFLIVNPSNDSDITSAYNWTSTKRKLLFVQTNSDLVLSDTDTDIATSLKKANAGRCVMYYHADEDENLAGSVASILASYPIGGKTASFKRPSNITVDEISEPQEGNLRNKNVNFYVYYIGGAGEYNTRPLTSDNGVTMSGEEIQTLIAIDRTALSLQSALMDGLEQDLPYDDRGGTILYDKVNGVYAQLKKEGVFAEDSVDEETGEMDKSYVIKVLTRATVKRNYPEFFKQKMFIIETVVNLAGSGKKVMITLAY